MGRDLIYLKGVEASRLRSFSGAHLASLEKHAITSVTDVLLTHPVSWHSPERGDMVSGVITAVTSGEKPYILVRSHRSSNTYKGAWIGQPWATRGLRRGDSVVMWGKRSAHGVWYNPQTETSAPPPPGAMAAVWRRRGRVWPRTMRTGVREALRRSRPVPDPLDPQVRAAHGLCDRDRALAEIAFPSGEAALEEARRRLVFDEFARILLTAPEPVPGNAVPPSDPPPLPFVLTGAQLRADGEIAADQASGMRMARLLHGDVGSGKTAVAALAAARAARAGYRTMVMAPTEILARQLHKKIAELGAVSARLETSDMSAKEKREADASAEAIVGTHALLWREPPEGIGLIVIDEQHRFGVKQRQQLLEAHPRADRLIMSATPIPRSLSQTLYGDLRVSVLDELPPGRRIRDTKRVDLGEAAGRLEEAAARGRPSFAVCPKINRGERPGWSVDAALEALRKRAPSLRYEVVTGKVRPGPRDKALSRLKGGETDVLVATTVVEVGLDVPNAMVMAVLDPHRFGLAQLHQLRGRVGRNEEDSEFLLVTDRAPGDDAPLREGAEERLAAVCEISSGFELALVDLSMRGPGQSWGEAQSGGMGLARPVEDEPILEAALESLPAMGEDMVAEAEALTPNGGWATRDF